MHTHAHTCTYMYAHVHVFPHLLGGAFALRFQMFLPHNFALSLCVESKQAIWKENLCMTVVVGY